MTHSPPLPIVTYIPGISPLPIPFFAFYSISIRTYPRTLPFHLLSFILPPSATIHPSKNRIHQSISPPSPYQSHSPRSPPLHTNPINPKNPINLSSPPHSSLIPLPYLYFLLIPLLSHPIPSHPSIPPIPIPLHQSHLHPPIHHIHPLISPSIPPPFLPILFIPSPSPSPHTKSSHSHS